MTEVRPLRPEDMADVAALFQQIFLNRRTGPSSELTACLADFYLNGPAADPDIPSWVHIDDNGAISGFIGVNVVPMAYSGKILRAAFCGAFMARDHEKNPLAGARLIKAFLSGRQDISITETANKTSLELSKALRGTAFAAYSLEWMRVFRPAAFACDIALRNSSLRPWALPAARGLDHLLRWSRIAGRPERHAQAAGTAPLMATAVDADAFASVVENLTAHYSLRPCWTPADLRHVVAHAFDKPKYGKAIGCLVTTGNAVPVGAFLYHMQAGSVGRVFQIMAKPGLESKVIDVMLADAARRGAAGLRGRIQPALLDGMLGKGILFATASSTIVFSRDNELLECFRSGRAFVNGIAGESWGRHIGGDFG